MRLVCRVAGAIAVVSFFIIGFTPVPNVLSSWMTRRAPLREAGAIVVLAGGGTRPDGTLTDTSLRRTYYGLRLYRQQLAPLLVLSGPPSAGRYVEAQVRAELVGICGVPSAAIATESSARTTYEEAVRIAHLLHLRGIRKIILVVDAEGTWRATRAFEKTGLEVIPVPAADVSALDTGPEGRFELMRRVVIELLALTYYRIAGHI